LFEGADQKFKSFHEAEQSIFIQGTGKAEEILTGL
jgi:hypothetical protein